jgi:hypothetical protein
VPRAAQTVKGCGAERFTKSHRKKWWDQSNLRKMRTEATVRQALVDVIVDVTSM